MCKKTEKTLTQSQILTMFPEFSRIDDREKTRIRKTAYYRDRINPSPLTLEELHHFTPAQIWELTRASQATISRWRNGHAIPYATQQLLKYRLTGVIPHGFGDWGGCTFGRDGRLYPKQSPKGYSAKEMECFYLIHQNAGRVPGLVSIINELEKELRFHKAITLDDSRMGFMRGLAEVLQE